MSYILALKPSLSETERFRQGPFRHRSHLHSCLSFFFNAHLKTHYIFFFFPPAVQSLVKCFAGTAGSEYLKRRCMKPFVLEGEAHHSISVSLIHFTHVFKRQAQIYFI